MLKSDTKGSLSISFMGTRSYTSPFFLIGILFLLLFTSILLFFTFSNSHPIPFNFFLPSDKPKEFFFFGIAVCTYISIERKKYFCAVVLLLIGYLWYGYYTNAVTYLRSLGSDSFSEATSFDIQEAYFWFSSLSDVVKQRWNRVQYFSVFVNLFLTYLFYFSVRNLFLRLSMKLRTIHLFQVTLALFAVIVALHQTFANVVEDITKNSRLIDKVSRNFRQPVPKILSSPDAPSVVVYIGESSTAMNMGIYGYFRNTTPLLSTLKNTDPKLLVFKKIVSTQVQTTPSLLEAFSFALSEGEQYLPIYDRKRLSIVDLFTNGDLPVTLLSNQGQTGTWNQASGIVFRSAEKKFSTDCTKCGNQEILQKRPFDHEFFSAHVDGILEKLSHKKSLVVLHSYAGHGAYYNFIPPQFQKAVDPYFQIKAKNATEDKTNIFKIMQNVDQYDSAISYIDFSVYQIIKRIQNNNNPIVFLYFSDHGEAPYLDRGHDAARFSHEMVRIPFIIYFNDAAKSKYPELFQNYQKFAASETIGSLAQLPSTILDIMGIKIEDSPDVSVIQTPPIGVKTNLSPILVRKTNGKITYINLNKEKLARSNISGMVMSDNTDKMTEGLVKNGIDPFVSKSFCAIEYLNITNQLCQNTLLPTASINAINP